MNLQPASATDFETPRLCLRRFTPADLDGLALINGDPEVMRYTGDGKPVSRDETERRLLSYIRHWQRHGFGLWAVAEKNGALIEPTIATRQHQPPHRLLPATSEASTDPELIGFCGLQFVHKSSEIEVGFRFAKRCWGRGLATEAAQASVRYGFERLALDRIIGLTHPDNTASQRVLEKAGLRYEKDAFYYNARVRYYAIERSCFWQS